MAGTTKAQIKAYRAKNPSTKSSGGSSSKLNELESVAAQAKSLGIDTSKADAMVAQTKRQGSTAFAGSDEEKAYLSTIPAKMKVETPAPIPTAPTVPDLGGLMTGNNASLAGGLSDTGTTYDAKTGQFVTAPGTTQPDNFQKLFEQAMGLGKSAFDEMGSAEDRLAQLEKANKLKQKQQAVNDYTAQLNQIVATRDAQVLSLEGQGRGITEAIIGGQQAQINREAAIKALPVQAQLAAAQGNLQLAQEHIDKMFTVQSQDALAKYNYKSSLINSVYSFATASEQRRLDAIKQREDRAYDMQKTNLSLKNDWAKTAIEYGQSSLAGSIMKLDPTAADFTERLAALQGQVSKPIAPKTVEPKNFGTADNPQWGVYDPTTNTIKPVSGMGDGSTPAQQTAESSAKLDALLGYTKQAKDLSSASGLGVYNRAATFLTGDSKYNRLSNLVDTLKVNLLTMNTDPMIKKFFGPNMSNRDTELMTSAGTTLNAEKMSPTDMNKELAAYEDVIKRAKGWTYLGGGGMLTVKLTDPQTKKTETVSVNYETLSQAVKDGIQVAF